MGKDPKKPTREPEFVNDVAVTYGTKPGSGIVNACLLYTSDAADD